jgi:hypothetical protein
MRKLRVMSYFAVTIEGDADGVFPPRMFDDFLSAIDYAETVLTPLEGVAGSPGVHITGVGDDYDDQVWTLERLRALQMIAGRR